MKNIVEYIFRQDCDTIAAAAAAKSLQSGPTLSDPIDGSPPGSPVPGTLQARTLEWVVSCPISQRLTLVEYCEHVK